MLQELVPEELLRGAPPEEAQSLRNMPGHTLHLADLCLEHCHGTARPGVTPDLLSLNRLISSSESIAAMLVERRGHRYVSHGTTPDAPKPQPAPGQWSASGNNGWHLMGQIVAVLTLFVVFTIPYGVSVESGYIQRNVDCGSALQLVRGEVPADCDIVRGEPLGRLVVGGGVAAALLARGEYERKRSGGRGSSV